MAERIDTDWVSRYADEVIAEAERRAPGRPVVCASGLSPSGPIHLGNLREVMTPHLVADEIRRRGVPCEHILSWDDYDRFRKVPAGVDPSWAEHIGRPLTAVPAPPGSPYPNWAEHFKAPMIVALAALGIEYRPISQSVQYSSGAYREQILLAMREREKIDAILDRYRTKGRLVVPAGPAVGDGGDLDVAGGDIDGEDLDGRGAGYFPYKPYCQTCNRDLTTVTGYDDQTTDLDYTCACGHAGRLRLAEEEHGKLVWKVDWPMRWAYEEVRFEPSGVDHSSPGSSFVVGGQIVAEVFGSPPPIGPMYAFVGISGMAKMSSSRGGVPTPADALEIMEPSLLRWLYARRRPNQAFKIAFDQEIQRVYDEFDALARRVADGSAPPADALAYHRAVATAGGPLPSTPRTVPFRALASIVDITTGDHEQTLRILREMDPTHPVGSLAEVRPRLDCAQRWVTTQVPAEQRTHVRGAPDRARLAALGPAQQESIRLLLRDLEADWSLDGLTTLAYAVPKAQLGLPPDTAPTAELKAAQREFFALLYHLLVGTHTGPRLPTLLLAIGPQRVRHLLGG